MGFSLQVFLDELNEILLNADMSPTERLTALEEAVKNGEAYARQCGLLE